MVSADVDRAAEIGTEHVTRAAPAASPPIGGGHGGQSGLAAGSGDRFVVACVLYATLAVLAIGHQVSGEGALQSPVALLDALKGPEWGLAEQAPDRHRPLLRGLVTGALRALGDDSPERLYSVYVTLQGLALLAAAGALDALLLALRFSGRQALLGGALLLVSYPVLFGHDLPLHAREDPLALAITALLLLAVAKDQLVFVALLGLVGATVRESCVAAALPALLVSARPVRERALALAPGLATLVLVRVLAGSAEPPVQGALWGAPLLPAEALLHAGLALGWVGAAALVRLLDPTPARHALLARGPVLLFAGGTLAAGLVTGVDARALTTLAPLALPLALDLAASGRLRALLRAPAALVALALVAVLGASALAWLAAHPERIEDLQAVLGEGWNPGVIPAVVVDDLEGGSALIDPSFASRLQGPFTIAHLALGTALLAGWLARGRRWTALRERTT